MSIYVIYDKTTNTILKSGVASSPDECALQITDTATQDVLAHDDSEQLEAAIAELGLVHG